MAPAKPRPTDDSRSETSSSITTLKEKTLAAAAGAGVSKSKKTHATAVNGAMKANTATNNTVADSTHTAEPVKTDWTLLSPSTLLTYRAAYRLPTPSCYTQPHADILYTSSTTAHRAPSEILARKRMHEFRQQQRSATTTTSSKTTINKKRAKNTTTTSTEAADHTASNDATAPSSPTPSLSTLPSLHPPPLPPTDPTPLTRLPPQALATAVRKHFNAQQLSEVEAVGKFLYVAHHSRRGKGVKTEGSGGSGDGWWMGGSGREVRRGGASTGGEGGFRMRFWSA